MVLFSVEILAIKTLIVGTNAFSGSIAVSIFDFLLTRAGVFNPVIRLFAFNWLDKNN